MVTPTADKPLSPLMAELDAKSRTRHRNWKRKSKISADENPVLMTELDAMENQRLERLGQTFLYRPEGRVTVKRLCAYFDIPRREFYRWKDGLLVAERKLLGAAMVGRLSAGPSAAGDDSWLRNEAADSASDQEIDERLGWKEPDEV